MELSKSIYKRWIEIHRNTERTARFGLGLKIDNLLLDLLELLQKTIYTPVDKKVFLLNVTSEKIDMVRFFMQILWENKFCPNKQYVSIETDIQNLGRMIGGWKKGLLSKTSAIKAEERKQ